MKNILLLLSLVLLLASCGKSGTVEEDLCLNVSCLNGGECDSGECDCLPNYTGTNCETVIDECYQINCLNGGVCNSGICDCPTGYTGSVCQTLVFPDSFKIHRIEVKSYVGGINFGFRYLIENTEYFSLYPFDIDLDNGDDYHEFFTPVTIPVSSTKVMRFQSINYNDVTLGEKSINPLIDPLPYVSNVNGPIYKFQIVHSNGDAWQDNGEYSIVFYGELIYE